MKVFEIVEKTTVKKDSSGRIRNVQYKDGGVTAKQTFRPDSTPGYQQATYDDPNKGAKYDVKGSPETGYTTSISQKVGPGKVGMKQHYSGQTVATAQLGKKKIKKTVETTSSSAIATSMGGGNGFANGGPGVVSRMGKKKKKKVEGKSPHKKGTKKYKAHMAAMHAG